MKKFLFPLICAVTSMLAVSCANDPIGPEEPNDNSLTFFFSGMGNGALTYAIATDDENQVDDLDIYMFEYSATQDGIFKKKFTSGEYTLTKSGTQHELKIENVRAYGESKKTFYFVANASPTTALDATALTEKDFAELLTEELQVVAGKGELLATPLLFTGKTATAISPTGTAAETVPMKRRVARFDIVNPYTDFVIEKVFVSDAKLQGFAFGNAKGTNSPVFPVKSLKEIDIDDPTVYKTEGTDRIAPHVFYLYPTTMGETTIAVQANYNGQGSELYYIDSDIDIKANYRYKMTVTPNAVGQVKFILDYVDWDTDVHMDVEKRKAMKVEDYKVDGNTTHTNWDLTNKTYDLLNSTAAKLTFTVRNALEVKEDISVFEGSWADVDGGTLDYTVNKVFTYGAAVQYDYEVTLPTAALAGGDFAIKMRISNKANPEEYEDIYIYKEAPIRLQYQYYNRGWLGWGYANLAPAIVPNGLRSYAMEDMPVSLDYPDGTFIHDLIPSANAGLQHNTNKKNSAHSWTFVSFSNSDEIHWTDTNAGGGTSSLNNVYVSALAHPEYTGCYKPFQYHILRNITTIAQGDTHAKPTIVKLDRMNLTAAVTLISPQNIPARINPATPPTLENDKLWVKIENLPLTASVGTGTVSFDDLSDPAVPDKYGAIAFGGFKNYGADLLSSTVGMFPTTSTTSDPNYVQPVVRLMYENTAIASFAIGKLLSNRHYDMEIDFTNVSVKISIDTPGYWTSVEVYPEF